MNSFNNNQDYYRKLIVEHYSKPKNKGFKNLPNSLTYHQTSNSCVDNFHVEIFIKNNIITSARFTGVGCAISTAAIDLFCILIEGKTIPQVKEIINNYQAMLAEKKFNDKIIENMIAFKNVPRQRNRIKCALIGINGINKLIGSDYEKYRNGD